MNLIGADISFYQDNNSTPMRIDFEKMRAAGSSFVIIRAGQNTWIDSEFVESWKRSKGVLPRGSYWFYDSRSKPADQARLWKDAIGDDLPECGVWMDFEENYGGAYRGEARFCEFAEAVKDLFPPSVEVGVYTAPYYWREHVTRTDYWHQYALWIANYQVSKPLIPAPWKADEWTFWQFTASGDGGKYGVESLRIDLNYFNGDEAEFSAMFGAQPKPPAEAKKIEITVTRKDTGASVTVEI